MTSKWETGYIGDLIQEPFLEVAAEPWNHELITVRLHAKGLIPSGKSPNRTRSARKHYFRRSGQILIGRQNFHRQCVGVVDETLDGLVTSNAISAFVPRSGVDKTFALLVLQSPSIAETADQLMPGTGQREISVRTLLSIPVAIPPLPEQRRIVDLIGALDDAIEAAKSKHQAAISVVDQMANSLPGEKNALANLLTTIDAGKSPSGVERTPLSGERAVLKVSAIGPNGFLPAEAKVVAPEVSLRDETRIKKDDVLLVRANGVISRVGATCIVKEDHPELFLCDKTLRLVPDRSSVMPHWLNIAMKSADVRSQIESLTGGSDMRNITQKSILQIEIPQPDMAIQETFADAFRGLDESVELAEKHIATLNFLRTELLTALLSGAHEIPESYDSVMELASV